MFSLKNKVKVPDIWIWIQPKTNQNFLACSLNFLLIFVDKFLRYWAQWHANKPNMKHKHDGTDYKKVHF